MRHLPRPCPGLRWLAPLLTGALFLTSVLAQTTMRVGTQPDGSIFVPTNQLLRPAGRQILTPGRPVDIDLSPDEKWLIVKNSKSLDLIRVADLKVMQELSLAPVGASFTGLEYSADGRTIYLTDEESTIHIANVDKSNTLHWTDAIPAPPPKDGGKPVPTGLALDEQKGLVYVTASRGNSVVAIRLSDKSATTIPVGVAPYDIALFSPTKAYVTNWGGRPPLPGESSYPSSGTPVRVDPKTGIADSGSVSVVDLAKGAEIKVIDVGLHPSGLILSPDRKRLYVACANSDSVWVIDTATDSVVEQISVRLRKELPFGSGPNALAISPDGTRLYVANGTDNAVCVVAIGAPSRVIGYIPTGWYPGSITIDRAGKRLFVANVKGVGSLSHGVRRDASTSTDFLGTVSVIPVPTDGQLAEMSRIVESNNSLDVLLKNLAATHTDIATSPARNGAEPVPRFKHVFYIIKENRTYDQVLGDMKQGDGEPKLVVFGEEVTPNTHALAERFGLLDNFYCSGALSVDGHQWTDEAYATDYVEKFFGDFTRSYPFWGGDPLAYASSGFIWDNALRHGLSFRDYGEFASPVVTPATASFMDILNDHERGTGKIQIGVRANISQLTPYLCPTYAGFGLTVPDVQRASVFVEELKQYEKKGNLPDFIILLLPNDHTAGALPGLPTPQAAVADNDLALGRIIDAITHSSFWKDTCVFVTEDDPQNGFDHVDAHRTVGLVISPYSRRGSVISTAYSQLNMFRTIEEVLGLPPINQLDLRAAPMSDCFGPQADLTPYSALPNRVPLDQLNPPAHTLSGKALYWARKSMEQDLSQVDRIDEDTFNRIIWHAVKGYDTPYPTKKLNGWTANE